MLDEILLVAFSSALVSAYMSLGASFAYGMESRTQKKLAGMRYLFVVTHWPLFVLAWCFMPKEIRPSSPFSPRTPEQDRIDRWHGKTDWQSRWDFFTEQAAEAKREGNPIARERAEEHLRFLEETRPKELKKLKSAPKPKSAPLPDDFKQQIERAVLLVHKIQPKNQVSPQSKVGFCNVCASYRNTKFSMEGVCLECYDEQGF